MTSLTTHNTQAELKIDPTDIKPSERKWSDLSHAVHLGKNRDISDIGHVLAPQDLKHFLRVEAFAQEFHSNPEFPTFTMRMLMRNRFGCDTMFPPVDPCKPRRELFIDLQKLSQSTLEEWKELNKLVATKEPEIQQSIIDLSEKEGPLGLEPLLERAWRTARDNYNTNHATPAQGIVPGFALDPLGEIAGSHASDLDNFSLDFLRDMDSECGFRRVPLYRNGANYSSDPGNNPQDWPNWSEPRPRKGGPVEYNIDVRGHIERVRASYLVPHINLADLTNPLNLLTFIHHRARMGPCEFARLDNDLTHLGRSSRILAGAFAPWKMISFVEPKSDPMHQWGFKFHDAFGMDLMPGTGIEINKEAYEKLYQSGNVFGCMEGWLVMQTQAITYSFLHNFCKEVMTAMKIHPPPADITSGKTEEEDRQRIQDQQRIKEDALAMIEKIKLKTTNGVENWQDLTALRQYEPFPTRANVNKYLPTLHSKTDAAEQHLTRLFNEPDYFLEAVLEQKRHHWANLFINYKDKPTIHIENYQRRSFRHHLYCDCVRSVLRSAVFGFFIWPLVETRLVEYDSKLQQAHEEKPAASFVDLTMAMESGEFKELFYIVRHCAILFLKEFSSKLIHASYEPMLQHYSRITQPDDFDNAKKNPCKFPRGLYNAPDRVSNPTRTTLHAKHDDLNEIVGELMNNFIANPTARLYVGVRKVTARLQRYLDDCEDEQTSDIFSNLVADTIDSLDVLAEIAQHLEDFLPSFVVFSEAEYVKCVSKACADSSIDLLAFDTFPYEDDGVPEKRTGRIYKFLDEAQGFDAKVTITIGQARGDLKRLGASLLRKKIVPMNKAATHKAKKERLARLEEIMQVRRDQYLFHEKENPIDLDQDEKIPVRRALTIWRDVKKNDNKEAIRRRKERKAREVVTKGFNEPVLNEIRRLELVKLRQKKENDRRHRLQVRKHKWNQRRQEEAGAGNEQPEDDEMEVDHGQELAEAVRQLVVQAQLAPEPEPQPAVLPPLPADQQPLPPAPEPRAPTPEPPRPPAPDDRPKRTVHKRVWKTLSAVYGKHSSKVSWTDLVKAMGTLGYREQGRGGSHGVFLWTVGCRWPKEALAKGHNIQLAKNHEGSRAGAARGKTKDWGFRLGQRGMTWDFIQEWYRQK